MIFILSIKVFCASEGWFQRFLKLHKLTFRRVTFYGRDLPTNVDKILDEFLTTSQRNLIVPNFDLSNLANMAETCNFPYSY